MVERNCVVAGQEGQYGLVENHQTEKHQDPCGGDSGQLQWLAMLCAAFPYENLLDYNCRPLATAPLL